MMRIFYVSAGWRVTPEEIQDFLSKIIELGGDVKGITTIIPYTTVWGYFECDSDASFELFYNKIKNMASDLTK